jgi:SAM-dependent methyltransferase
MTTNTPAIPVYDNQFFTDIEEGSLSSAETVVPIVTALIKPKSVIDVGCGQGVWLSVFARNGISDYTGIDGSYVNPQSLQIPNQNFIPTDLNEYFTVPNRAYDLAICLEVAEHLSPSMSDYLIEKLTSASPVVLFSAAIPGQGGVDHRNEQPFQYWYEKFKARGFLASDAVRTKILNNSQVKWWYRQNIFLYIHESCCDQFDWFQHDEQKLFAAAEWVHINMIRQPEPSIRRMIRELPKAFYNGVRNQVRRFT